MLETVLNVVQKNESQEHHLNACSSELSSLRREIETLKQQLTETTQSQLEILSSNSTLIKNLYRYNDHLLDTYLLDDLSKGLSKMAAGIIVIINHHILFTP